MLSAKRLTGIATVVVLIGNTPQGLYAHEGDSELIDELIVLARAQQMLGVAASASEGIVGYDDIRIPPLLRVGELAEAVPGMVATQHSGTGKANQYFLRGFNLDHGTDFSGTANGVPINMRTHGHGQGYLDLNFLIPELVETTTYRKGPYHASVGDFSSAGSVDFNYYDVLEEGLLSAKAGEFGYFRALAAGSTTVKHGAITGAVDISQYDGPWELSEDATMNKAYLAYSGHLGAARTRLSLSAYEGEWISTDQVPRRAIESGLISRLGFIDPDLGGRTDRYEATANFAFDKFEVTAYAIDYDFQLFSNFTYLLDRPDDGDQFEQVDKRRIYGANIKGEIPLATGQRPLTLMWGGDFRYDDIRDVALYDTVERERRNAVRRDSVDQWSVSAYGDALWSVSDRLRLAAGLRVDHFDWDVAAQRDENNGTGDDTLLSPKLNAAYRVAETAELYVNWGRGFHSNDVRGTTISVDPRTGLPVDPVDALVQSEGAEIGFRFEAGETFNATVTTFWLELDSELVFVGDAGTTEANDGTERLGLEVTGFWQPVNWLAVNASYTYTDAKFRQDQGGGREIPGAVDTTASLGFTAAWANGAFASLRGRYLGDAPLIEDGSVRDGGSTLVNAGVGYRWDRIELRLEAFNLFDSNENDITYYYASRLPDEPAEGVEDVHLHPLEPRSLRASVTFIW